MSCSKIGFEKYFMSKIKKGISEPFYERIMHQNDALFV